MLHRIVLTAASVIALTAAVNAADMHADGYKGGPSYATVNWSGLYIGVNGGYGFASGNQFSYSNAFDGISPNGGFGGGQIGYNVQGVINPHVVLGVEADIQGAGISDSKLAPRIHNYTFSSNLDYVGTVRARAGFAEGSWLVYATGGLAYGGITNRAYSSADNFEDSGAKTGYVLGGGVEHKFTNQWSVKAEYKYIDLGKNDPVGVGTYQGKPLSSYGANVQDDAFHTVSVGVNYRFNGIYEPLK